MRKRRFGQPLTSGGCRLVRRRRTGCPPPEYRVLRTLDDVVDAYLAHYRERASSELAFYRAQPTFEEVVRVAALSIRGPDGKRHDHQRRIPLGSLKDSHAALQKAALNLRRVKDFDALHEAIVGATRGIPKIGPLVQYDVTQRIGAWLGLAPRKVYLHAGAQEGARALGVRGDTAERSAFPRELRRLTAAQLEDCLCIYKEDIKHMVQRGAERARPGMPPRDTRPTA